ALDAAVEVGQRRVHEQVVDGDAVRRADELHAALVDRAGGQRLKLAANLVDDDDLGVVVLHRLDHDLVLEARRRHLHAARPAYRRVGDVAISADLVGGVHDHHAVGLGEHARRLAQHRRLADAGAAQEQHALARADDVLDNVNGAEYGPAHTARQPDHIPFAIADRGDAVQRAIDAGAVVGVELTDLSYHRVDGILRNVLFGEDLLAVGVACGWHAAQVEDHFDQVVVAPDLHDDRGDLGRQHV